MTSQISIYDHLHLSLSHWNVHLAIKFPCNLLFDQQTLTHSVFMAQPNLERLATGFFTISEKLIRSINALQASMDQQFNILKPEVKIIETNAHTFGVDTSIRLNALEPEMRAE